MSESTMTTSESGDRIWKNIFGQKHRLDGPAVERADGSKYWYQNGQLHRVDGPAVENSDGTKYWYQNGQKHRLDGPAIEWGIAKFGPRWYHNNRYLGQNIDGFWELWNCLDEKERQNVNLHMWLARLTNV